MDKTRIVEIETRHMATTYAKRPIVAVKGRGALLWDIHGETFIDCMSAYGVCVVGHCHPKIVQAVQEQADTLIACHSSLYNEARSRFLEKLTAITPKGLDRAFLCNSGTEAVEAAIKLARKHTGKPGIIAFMGAYHGKTMGALSGTWNRKYRTPFEPLVPGFSHVPYGKIDKVRAAISDETAAVIVEPIQGEGGVKVPPVGFLGELRELCDETGVLLIFDEVQTGFGRTGKLFACEHSQVVPDVLCLAKSLAGGLPIGVTVGTDEVVSSFTLGSHTSTFGGNPLVCAAAAAAIDVVVEEKLADRAMELGHYFMEQLRGLNERYRISREVRGKGLMVGMVFRFDVLNLILGAMSKNVLILDAGRNILRFLPPLVISRAQLDRVIEVLDAVIGEEDAKRSG